MEKNNIIISSKNRLSDESVANITITLPKTLVAKENEYFSVNMVQFNSIKGFYSVQKDLNSNFKVFIYDGDEEYLELDMEIPEGNYDVYTLRDKIASKTFNTIRIEYDKFLNKYIFYNIYNNPDFSVKIMCINSGVFFGLENNIEYLVPVDGFYSTKFVNISGYEHLIIHISGDVNIENSISNVSNNKFNQSQILGIIPVSNIAPMDTISYDNNDGGVNFNHKIFNKQITTLKIFITNENGVVFPQLSNYLLTLQITKNTINNTENLLSGINQKLEDIAYFIIYITNLFKR